VKDLFILTLAVLLLVLGNTSIGYGMQQVGTIAQLHPDTIVSFAQSTLTNQWVLLGLTGLAGYFLLFLIALSRLDLSYVQPMIAANYSLTALLAWLILGESISVTRWAGTLLVTLGITIVGLSEHQRQKRLNRDR
jgi:bacterial/archaeal transporter family protein